MFDTLGVALRWRLSHLCILAVVIIISLAIPTYLNVYGACYAIGIPTASTVVLLVVFVSKVGYVPRNLGICTITILRLRCTFSESGKCVPILRLRYAFSESRKCVSISRWRCTFSESGKCMLILRLRSQSGDCTMHLRNLEIATTWVLNRNCAM